MFDLTGVEVLVVVVWLIGVVVAVDGYRRGDRGPRGVAVILLAIAVPVVGSLLALVRAVGRRTRSAHSTTRSTVQDLPHHRP
ncbi:hypothetical protein [Intrasporangium sp. DVR]|uniref:hypothetical protein n=1 Tax=Intrasporangium sp. DVR TaxID=3127867 RepID=UPI00313A4F71